MKRESCVYIALLILASSFLVDANLHDLLDPKSVEEKGKHDYSDLKFLFLGTSRTYGALLQDRERTAFPYLLHTNATNLGIPSSSSFYPSDCVSSMLKDYGDEVFDLIVLEFIGPHIQKTLKLVTRLNTQVSRYPVCLSRHVAVDDVATCSFWKNHGWLEL